MDENGILERLPGELIAHALQKFPSPDTDENLSVVIDAGDLGMVRVYAKRCRARRGKHSHYFWVAYQAEVIPEQN